jgi:8-oxo-dGTP pyrophosphatase MutT (NUDIX family)
LTWKAPDVPISDYLRGIRAKLGPDLLLTPSVTGVIFDGERRLLMVLHSDRRIWVLPGGCIDPGETPADAVVREVWEETGLAVEPVALRGVYSGPDFLVRYPNGDEAIYVMSVFECRPTGGSLKPDGVETLAVRYFSEAELSGVPTPVWARRIFPDLFAGTARGFFAPTWRPPE